MTQFILVYSAGGKRGVGLTTMFQTLIKGWETNNESGRNHFKSFVCDLRLSKRIVENPNIALGMSISTDFLYIEAQTRNMAFQVMDAFNKAGIFGEALTIEVDKPYIVQPLEVASA